MKILLSVIGITLLLAVGPSRAVAPNIVFIIADDLGYGDISPYGQEKIRTPNIQKLSEQGMRFSACYSGHNVCAPSRCVFMTGLHPGHAYIRENRQAKGYEEGQVPVPAGPALKPGATGERVAALRARLGLAEGSAYDAALAKVDGDNRFLWRMNRQRLDAEEVRDTVLAVSGKLDLKMGGPGFELFRFKDDHSPVYDHTALEKIHDPATYRRTTRAGTPATTE